jgi:hypothetical protein
LGGAKRKCRLCDTSQIHHTFPFPSLSTPLYIREVGIRWNVQLDRILLGFDCYGMLAHLHTHTTRTHPLPPSSPSPHSKADDSYRPYSHGSLRDAGGLSAIWRLIHRRLVTMYYGESPRRFSPHARASHRVSSIEDLYSASRQIPVSLAAWARANNALLTRATRASPASWVQRR